MTEPTYVLAFIAAATTVATVLTVGILAAAGLIFTGERKARNTRYATGATAERTGGAAPPSGRPDRHAE